jgi:hypothetical protein
MGRTSAHVGIPGVSICPTCAFFMGELDLAEISNQLHSSAWWRFTDLTKLDDAAEDTGECLTELKNSCTPALLSQGLNV